MVMLIITLLGMVSGFVLFRRKLLVANYESAYNGEAARDGSADKDSEKPSVINGAWNDKLSVIIPARNEEVNLPHLLRTLQEQTVTPYEIIVVDDQSTDRTREIAESFGVRVITCSDLPLGWTGKNWAVWNGYLQATGDLLAFIDTDVRLAPNALALLLAARRNIDGVISVVPYHYTEKWYERLALILNVLAMFTFMSPFEVGNKRRGLYGSLILTTREAYEAIGGHENICSEVLDDLKLGEKFRSAGITTDNFMGYQTVSFRMYPRGLAQVIEGFSKGAALSTSTLRPVTIFFHALWVIGLLLSGLFPISWGTTWFYPLLTGYVLYTLQLMFIVRYVGNFGIGTKLLHVISSYFFLFVLLYSMYQVVVLRSVIWKGRNISVGGRDQ